MFYPTTWQSLLSGLHAGLIDTNVFIHARTYDAHPEQCLNFLEAVQRGAILTPLDPVVLHELCYALPHYRKGMSRSDIAEYLLAVLAWEGIVADKAFLIEAVERWRDAPGLAFVDAYLSARAARDDSPVFSKKVAELEAQGISIPNPLPR